MERWHRKALGQAWPLFDLVVRTPRLVLQVPTDADLVALADAAADIHEPGTRPLRAPWAAERGLARDREFLRAHWANRASWSPERWDLDLAVWDGDTAIGVQTVRARDFGVRRTVQTSSWLRRASQGQGFGTEMRRAALQLAFAGLGAVRAETDVHPANAASLRVAAKLGYRANGDDVRVDGDGIRPVHRFVLDVEAWTRTGDVDIDGLAPCLPHLGAGPALAPHLGARPPCEMA